MFYGPRTPKGTSTKRTKGNTRPVPDTMSGGMPTGHRPPTPGSTSGGTTKKAVLKPARSTGTPKARVKTKDSPMRPPVAKRTPPTVASKAGTSMQASAKTMTSAADAARLAKLKEAMKKKYASDRAGAARSTGTPKMAKRPAVTGRMTRKPTAATRRQASIQASRRR